MLFAGFNVSEGDLTMFGIIAAGVLGNVVGSWIAWAAGYYGRLELLEKNRLIHINPKHLAWADDWFQRHGDATVFFTRMLPIIRTFISLPAGIAKMPFWRFTWLTSLGCIPWVTMLAFIGREVGDNWEEWRDYLHYFDYPVAAAILAGIVYFLIKRRGCGPPPAPGRHRGVSRRPRRPSHPRRRAVAARPGPGADRAPAGLELRAHLARSVPGRVGVAGARLRGAQELRGRPSRRHRSGAPDLAFATRSRRSSTSFDARRASVVALSFAPPAVAGLAFERRIEALGTPRATAAGLALGAIAMAARRPRAAHPRSRRRGRARRPPPGLRAGVRADPGRLAKRRDAHRGARPALRPRAGEPPLAHRRAAGDPGRGRPQRHPARQAGRHARHRPGARDRRRPPRSPRRSPRSA